MKKALITGVTGQDGSYLSEFLIEKGYDVHGIIRRSSVDYRERIAHLEGNPHFVLAGQSINYMFWTAVRMDRSDPLPERQESTIQSSIM